MARCGISWAAQERSSKAFRKANSGIHPTGSADSCSDFFNTTLMADVMKTEGKLIQRFNLGSCCSS